MPVWPEAQTGDQRRRSHSPSSGSMTRTPARSRTEVALVDEPVGGLVQGLAREPVLGGERAAGGRHAVGGARQHHLLAAAELAPERLVGGLRPLERVVEHAGAPSPACPGAAAASCSASR